MSVCVFVCGRCNLRLISANQGKSGFPVSGRINCYLIHSWEVTENAEFMDFDGVSASSTTSAYSSNLLVIN